MAGNFGTLRLLTLSDLNARFESSFNLSNREKGGKSFSVFNGYVYRNLEIQSAWTGYCQAAKDLGMLTEQPVTNISDKRKIPDARDSRP